MTTLYDVLGVSKDADEQEIKKAFRSMSLKYHPDRNPDESATEKFQEINSAYDTLGNPAKRNEYNAKLDSSQFRHPFGPGGMPGGPGVGGDFQDINHIFNMMFGGGGGGGTPGVRIFHGADGGLHGMGMPGMGGMGGMGSVPGMMGGHPFGSHPYFQQAHMQKPPVIVKNIQITLEQAYQGCSVPLEYERWKMVAPNVRDLQQVNLHANIPPGMENGEFVILQDAGNILHDNLKGDVKIGIEIQPDPIFQRAGMDLMYKKKITLKEALCGFSFELRHLNGKMLVLNNQTNVSVIHPGYKKLVPQMGMMRDARHGNLIVEFDVEFPASLTLAQQEALQALLG